MNALLRWSIENAGAGEDAPQQQPGQPGWTNRPLIHSEPQKFDTGIIDAILGKPDSEVMKEALAVAVDQEAEEDDRLQALDNFEMLIEHIDNANNIDKMKMWPTLQGLLSSKASSDELRAAVLWIVGTATQNNPQAQKDYLAQFGSPMSAILQRLSPKESSKQTRSRAVYALSGLLKHNTAAVKLLESNDGWKILKDALQDPEIQVRRKVVFLLGSLLLPNTASDTSTSHTPTGNTSVGLHGSDIADPSSAEPSQPPQPEHPNSHMGMTPESTETSGATVAALQTHGIAADLVEGLVNPVPHGPDGDQEGDADFEEKLIRLLYTYLTTVQGSLSEGDKKRVLEWLIGRREKGEDWDLTVEELDELQRALAPTT